MTQTGSRATVTQCLPDGHIQGVIYTGTDELGHTIAYTNYFVINGVKCSEISDHKSYTSY